MLSQAGNMSSQAWNVSSQAKNPKDDILKVSHCYFYSRLNYSFEEVCGRVAGWLAGWVLLRLKISRADQKSGNGKTLPNKKTYLKT